MASSVAYQAWRADARSVVAERLAELDTDAQLTGDACLQDCCRRDVRDQIWASKRDEELRKHDPSRGPSSHPAFTLPPPQSTSAEARDSPDAELSTLRDLRMKQLQKQTAAVRAAQSEGYGQLLDVTEDEAMALLEECPAVVVHTHEPGIGSEADEWLAQSSHRYLGTRFVRVPASQSAALLRRCQRPLGAWLIAARAGKLCGCTGAAPPPEGTAEAEEKDDLDSDADLSWEEGIEEWLRRCKVLQVKLVTQGHTRSHFDAGLDAENEEAGAGGDGEEPCAICGRTYYHVHKSGVRQSHAASGYAEDGF